VTDEGRACLADFGLAVIGDLTRTRMPTTTEVFGTFRWLAPELCQSENEMTRKTLAGDVFAFGRLCLAVSRSLNRTYTRYLRLIILFWQVCTQRAPFHGVSDYTVVFKLMKGEKPDRPSEQDCAGYPMSDDLWQLANDCWEALPGGRPKIFEVLERLQDLDDCV
jgi:serine/threonine protein kinase